MVGNYGTLPAALRQTFTATALNKEYDDEVMVHTDGVILSTANSPLSQFRMIPGKLYRVTVEEIEA